MAMLPNNTYEFKSLFAAIDFIKPLLSEGYPVVMQKIYGVTVFPTMERECVGYKVQVGPKDEEVKVYLPNDKAESDEGCVLVNKEKE